jgi:histidyl-tRNA synthetase
LVKEQAFVFQDRGGEEITLRPELTPSLARMVSARIGQLTFPVRWWSFGPFWRYERPQKGRTREFFQWNIDMLGVNSPEADAELVAIAATFLKTVGLTPGQAVVLVNNRRLMEAEFRALGIAEEKWPEVSGLVDRRTKMEEVAWEAYAIETGLKKAQINGLKSLLMNADLWKKNDELTRLFASLQELDVEEYVKFDPSIMRGLLYYTGTVFEAFDITGGVRRAILGGGRYDNLLADVGGNPLAGVGFAMGDVVIGIILQEKGLVPSFALTPAPVLVTIFDVEQLPDSLALAAMLRRSGVKVTCYPEPAKLPRQFKFADRMGMRLVLVVGPDEAAKGQVTVKDLASGTQETVKRDQLISAIQHILASD